MNLCENHDVYIVRFYVHMYTCKYAYVCMYLYPYFVACLKQCIVGVPETSRLILKVYLFVFALFLDKQV